VLVGLAAAAAVVVGVAMAFWKPIDESVAAWWGGSRADDIVTLPAWPLSGHIDMSSGEIEIVEFARFLSIKSGVNIIVPEEYSRSPKNKIVVASDMTNLTPDAAISLLRENGWRLRRRKFEGAEVYTMEPMRR